MGGVDTLDADVIAEGKGRRRSARGQRVSTRIPGIHRPDGRGIQVVVTAHQIVTGVHDDAGARDAGKGPDRPNLPKLHAGIRRIRGKGSRVPKRLAVRRIRLASGSHRTPINAQHRRPERHGPVGPETRAVEVVHHRKAEGRRGGRGGRGGRRRGIGDNERDEVDRIARAVRRVRLHRGAECGRVDVRLGHAGTRPEIRRAAIRHIGQRRALRHRLRGLRRTRAEAEDVHVDSPLPTRAGPAVDHAHLDALDGRPGREAHGARRHLEQGLPGGGGLREGAVEGERVRRRRRPARRRRTGRGGRQAHAGAAASTTSRSASRHIRPRGRE